MTAYRYEPTASVFGAAGIWKKHQLGFILCNPSTAGRWTSEALESDDTVERLIQIALHDKAGGFVLVNLATHVETKSQRLLRRHLANDDYEDWLQEVRQRDFKLVIGWGSRQLLRSRASRFLTDVGTTELWCVGRNKSKLRTPMHPLQRGPKRLQLERYLNTHSSDTS